MTGITDDDSSVKVLAATPATVVATGSDWCDITELGLAVVDPASLTTNCPETNMPPGPLSDCSYGTLAALDVKPTGVMFPAPNSGRPELRFDLIAHPPECRELEIPCNLVVYQFLDPDWVQAGQASEIIAGFADAKLRHFSIFVLVELPQPTPIPGIDGFQTEVGSDWYLDEGGPLQVALTISQPELAEFGLDVEGHQRFVSFRDARFVVEGVAPPACDQGFADGDELTCLLPQGTGINLTWDGAEARIEPVGLRYFVVITATAFEVF